MSDNPLPAAQYLRMSTERQEYSLDNQATAIKHYVDAHGFAILRTYSDAGRSGLVLNERRGLQSLLRDVISGAANYSAILVYDVSDFRTPTKRAITSSSVSVRASQSTTAPSPSPTMAHCLVLS